MATYRISCADPVSAEAHRRAKRRNWSVLNARRSANPWPSLNYLRKKRLERCCASERASSALKNLAGRLCVRKSTAPRGLSAERLGRRLEILRLDPDDDAEASLRCAAVGRADVYFGVRQLLQQLRRRAHAICALHEERLLLR